MLRPRRATPASRRTAHRRARYRGGHRVDARRRMTYFDSCYLAKLYLTEPDTPPVRTQAEASDGLACCSVGRGEVIATFHRHFREKRLTQRQFRSPPRSEADLDAGLWTSLPVTSAVVETQARRMALLPANVFLRAADALHLACALEAELREIYGSDRHLSPRHRISASDRSRCGPCQRAAIGPRSAARRPPMGPRMLLTRATGEARRKLVASLLKSSLSD